MARVNLLGHPTWVKVPKGKGKTVVFLHGGLSSSHSLLRDLGPGLGVEFAVAAFDRRGHGRTSDSDEPFSFSAMADETIAFLTHLGRRCHVVGHSDGAIVALLVALRRPELVRRVVAIGTNYHYGGLMPLPAFTPQSPDFPDFAIDYATRSPDGIEHAAVVVEKSRLLWASEPTLTPEDLARVAVPVLVMAGDDDVATLAHTVSLYESLPEAQLAVVPGTSHSLLKERTELCVELIDTFLRGPVPPVTRAPIRRGATDPRA